LKNHSDVALSWSPGNFAMEMVAREFEIPGSLNTGGKVATEAH
jgi:hypothetical protein